MPTLADIYSAIGSAKRRMSDFVGNPMTSAQQMLGYANDRARVLNEMTAAAAQEQDLYGPQTQALGQKLAEAYNPVGMTVWHGSPHVFERFDLGKIGAGTGQQVYGKGLYMAQNPTVAKEFRSALSNEKGNLLVDGELVKPKNYNLTKMIATHFDDPQNLNKKLSNYIEKNKNNVYADVETANDLLQALSEGKTVTPESSGNLYKVDLPDTHIRRMLDFDAPLKDQPYPVRNLAKKLGMDMNDLGGDLLEKVGKTEAGREALQQAGIPGIKYYDQMKGGKSQWTRNFVVFDPNHLNILERNAEKLK